MGAMLKFGSEGDKQFYDMFVLKPEHAKAHRAGDIHIHDLDFLTLTTTCCQIDIKSSLKVAFPRDTAHAESQTISPPMPRWAALRFSPIRMISTAGSRSITLTMAWPTACGRPLSHLPPKSRQSADAALRRE